MLLQTDVVGWEKKLVTQSEQSEGVTEEQVSQLVAQSN